MIAVSLSAFGVVSAEVALSRAFAAGVREVELAIGPEPSGDLGALVRGYQGRGVSFRAHHAFSFQAPTRPFDLVRNFEEGAMVHRLDWLARHGVTAYSVHAGSYDAGPREAAYALMVQRLDWLEARCGERGIDLGVETMFAMPKGSRRQNLLVGLDEISRLLRDAPSLGLVVDLAHLAIGSDPPERRLAVFECGRGRILEVHVSDNDGRRDLHTPLSPATWWWPFRSAIPTDVPIVLESRIRNADLRGQLALLAAVGC